ncbi:MAG: (2Fe-2S) ferredoxin domain-containing protein [Cyanobacteria bacterium P01_D01_bin.1]
MSKKVLVCQNTTCKQQGSEQVLAAFERKLSTEGLDQIKVEPSGCLGQCGNGPMVLVTGEKIWYSQVQIRDVPIIVKQHLLGDRLVRRKLYPQMHAQQSFVWVWLVGLAAFFGFCIGIAVIVGGRYIPS